MQASQAPRPERPSHAPTPRHTDRKAGSPASRPARRRRLVRHPCRAQQAVRLETEAQPSVNETGQEDSPSREALPAAKRHRLPSGRAPALLIRGQNGPRRRSGTRTRKVCRRGCHDAWKRSHRQGADRCGGSPVREGRDQARRPASEARATISSMADSSMRRVSGTVRRTPAGSRTTEPTAPSGSTCMSFCHRAT